jgi:ATP-binding cassette subfamily C (CFTR/MRP) protein 1
VALRRIESALNAQETTKYDSEQPDASSAGFRDVTASWADFKEDLFALRGINLDLSPGLHVVTGQVGDGKSSLLMALLHEMLVSRGIVFAPSAPTQRLHLTNRRTAYCAQSAFLISGTCRENILWGSEYDELRCVLSEAAMLKLKSL